MTSLTQEELLREVVTAASADPAFGKAIQRALAATLPKRKRRRPAPTVDPFAAFERGGESELREQLGTLDLEQLKDVVAHHQMDRAKLAMKWQAPERLVELIVAQTVARARKGEAFLR